MSCFQSPILNGTNRSITFNLIMLSRPNEAKKKTLKLLNNIMWRIYLTVLGKVKTNRDSPGVLSLSQTIIQFTFETRHFRGII